jgi:hypothetical protein
MALSSTDGLQVLYKVLIQFPPPPKNNKKKKKKNSRDYNIYKTNIIIFSYSTIIQKLSVTMFNDFNIKSKMNCP